MVICTNAGLPQAQNASSPSRSCKYYGQSVRSFPVRIITVGRKRSRGVQLLVEEYKEKLKFYCNVEDVLIRSNPKNTSDEKAQVEGEDMVVMQHIRPKDWVIMLDECGLDISSEQMAELVANAANTGSSALSFCIGGPYGHGRQLRERANSMDDSQRAKVSSLANRLHFIYS